MDDFVRESRVSPSCTRPSENNKSRLTTTPVRSLRFVPFALFSLSLFLSPPSSFFSLPFLLLLSKVSIPISRLDDNRCSRILEVSRIINTLLIRLLKKIRVANRIVRKGNETERERGVEDRLMRDIDAKTTRRDAN